MVAEIYIESWNEGFGDLMPAREVDHRTIARWRADLTQGLPSHWWVAVRSNSLVGFAGIGPSRDPVARAVGELDTIAVAPSHWRSGIGRALISLDWVVPQWREPGEG